MSLRKTKTDRVDAKTIAVMLMSNVDRKPYTDTAYHNEELQPLTSKTDYSFHFCKRQSEQQKTGAHSLKFGCVLRFDLMV